MSLRSISAKLIIAVLYSHCMNLLRFSVLIHSLPASLEGQDFLPPFGGVYEFLGLRDPLCHFLVHVVPLDLVPFTLSYYREQMRLSDTYSGSIIHGFGVWFKQGEVRRLQKNGEWGDKC